MGEINLNNGIYAELFTSYSNIHASYYNGAEQFNPFHVKCADFQLSPLFAFDTSGADESLINSSVDIRVEINTRANIPAHTAAYCPIIYDNEFTYSPFDGLVMRKI